MIGVALGATLIGAGLVVMLGGMAFDLLTDGAHFHTVKRFADVGFVTFLGGALVLLIVLAVSMWSAVLA